MTLGEFRRMTKDLPDETDLVGEFGGDDLYFYEANIRVILPPVLEHSNAVWLTGGHPINIDLDMDARVDAYLGI